MRRASGGNVPESCPSPQEYSPSPNDAALIARANAVFQPINPLLAAQSMNNQQRTALSPVIAN